MVRPARLVPTRRPSSALKAWSGGADSEDDSTTGTDGNQPGLGQSEKGRRTTPPFSCPQLGSSPLRTPERENPEGPRFALLSHRLPSCTTVRRSQAQRSRQRALFRMFAARKLIGSLPACGRGGSGVAAKPPLTVPGSPFVRNRFSPPRVTTRATAASLPVVSDPHSDRLPRRGRHSEALDRSPGRC